MKQHDRNCKKRSADETKAFGDRALFEVQQYTDSGSVCDFNTSAVDFLCDIHIF